MAMFCHYFYLSIIDVDTGIKGLLPLVAETLYNHVNCNQFLLHPFTILLPCKSEILHLMAELLV